MPEASGWITSRLRSSLCIFRIISRRCFRFISCQWRCVGWLVAFLFFSCGLGFMLTFLCQIQLGPARLAKTTQSPQRGRAVPFQDNARHHLHNRQDRSHALHRAGTLQRKCGLSCRARLCRRFYPHQATPKTLKEFQTHTTTPKGWPLLFTPLRTLLHRQETQLSCFHVLPHSLRKTTGGGVSL